MNYTVPLARKMVSEQSADIQATSIMSLVKTARFIQHYQRLTEHALRTTPNQCDIVLALDNNRQVVKAKCIGVQNV